MQFGPAVIFTRTTLGDLGSTLVTELRTSLVFTGAAPATSGQLATRHSYEGALGAVDNLQVADNKTIIDCDTAESAQLVTAGFNQLDPNFSDLHQAVSL